MYNLSKMTPQDIIEKSTDQQFREHLLKMPVGKGIALPVAGYVRYILMMMTSLERENMGPKNFARTILVFRTVAEFPKHGKHSLNTAHEVLKSVDLADPDFDVNQFMQQVKNRLYAEP